MTMEYLVIFVRIAIPYNRKGNKLTGGLEFNTSAVFNVEL